LRGKGIEVWKPRFTFHGFRYVEVTGWPGQPTVDDIEGLRMNSDLQQVGQFECSNEMFNKLHEAIQWTFLSNVFSVQSDCPGREKMGYGADMVVTADAFMFNYDMSNFYRKAVHDFANEQQEDGGITEMAPYMGIADKGYGGESGPLGWELAFPFLQKKLYEYYGDKSIIEENYPLVQRQIHFLQSKAIDGLFHWDISDHEALDPKPEAFSAAVFYYHHMKLAEFFAGVLGKKEDSLAFAKAAVNIRNSIVKKYYVPGTGRFDNGTQSAQLFALWYNLSPEDQKTFEQLLQEFERHKWHTSSGIFGNKMMFDVLREKNRNDIAYKIADQRDYPSWGYMLQNGATTLWETWAYPENFPSQNHPMFGSIDEWFYRSVLGINSVLPGFEKIMIKPQPVKELSQASGQYQSVRGNIGSSWTYSENVFALQVTVPPNTRAEVWVPADKDAVLRESNSAIAPVRFENGYAIVEIGSGTYHFQSQLSL
jgi:alpha-L-rhamnosidase